jgi:hypothetical protein
LPTRQRPVLQQSCKRQTDRQKQKKMLELCGQNVFHNRRHAFVMYPEGRFRTLPVINIQKGQFFDKHLVCETEFDITTATVVAPLGLIMVLNNQDVIERNAVLVLQSHFTFTAFSRPPHDSFGDPRSGSPLHWPSMWQFMAKTRAAPPGV